jgi:hypothetical protein
VSSTLAQLWTELHGGAPLQLHLPLGTGSETARREKVNERQYERLAPAQPNLLLGEKLSVQPFARPESFAGQEHQ